VELEPVLEHTRQALELVSLALVTQRAGTGVRVDTAELLQRGEDRSGLCNPRARHLFAPARVPCNGRRLEAVGVPIDEAQADEQSVLE
jgi:hypothetical protein